MDWGEDVVLPAYGLVGDLCYNIRDQIYIEFVLSINVFSNISYLIGDAVNSRTEGNDFDLFFVFPYKKCIKGFALKKILLWCSINIGLITSRVLFPLLIDDISDNI